MKFSKPSGAGHAVPEHENAALEQLKRLAWLLDSCIRLPGGFRIGVDALIGLIPFLGDAVGVLLSTYIVARAMHQGVPRSVLVRMFLNIGIDGLVGLIPFAGDFFDAVWKANQRNVLLLLRHHENPAHTARSSRRLIAIALVGLILFLAVAGSLSALLLGWLWHAFFFRAGVAEP